MEIEVLKLIAKRHPPGDCWFLISDKKTIYNSLTETLEAYYQKSQERCDFRLSPIKGELYIIKIEEEEKVIKKFNIYGDQ